ncbi:MAG: hypothetical protein ACTSRS_18850 [Candidatus Helarchaeota archaeon]
MRLKWPMKKNSKEKSKTSTTSKTSARKPQTVAEAIDYFTKSTFPSKWRHIQKEDLLNDLRDTLADPFQINQSQTPFCGPASITFELVRREPIQYVLFMKQLFEKGQFMTKTGKVIKAGKKLLESQVPSGVSTADWVFIGTLRDDKNLFFSIKSSGGTDNPSGAAGNTGVPAMKSWVKHILGYRKAPYKSTILYGDIRALKNASNAYNRGGVAFLLIHSGLIDNNLPDWSGPQIPNHWISFMGNLAVKRRNMADAVKFDVYSWGRRYHISTSKSTFRQSLTGIVIGKS